uniref:Uncharacterized protein n=1 Tax=Cucumis melo TaxID=3656 RepID=A0A9I9ELH9_CUCME
MILRIVPYRKLLNQTSQCITSFPYRRVLLSDCRILFLELYKLNLELLIMHLELLQFYLKLIHLCLIACTCVVNFKFQMLWHWNMSSNPPSKALGPVHKKIKKEERGATLLFWETLAAEDPPPTVESELRIAKPCSPATGRVFHPSPPTFESYCHRSRTVCSRQPSREASSRRVAEQQRPSIVSRTPPAVESPSLRFGRCSNPKPTHVPAAT